MAGKYIKLLRIEKQAAYATMAAMHRFSALVNGEYLSGVASMKAGSRGETFAAIVL